MGDVVALILLGVLVGTLIGGLGGGGGVIAVPMFIWICGMAPSDAGTISLIAVAAAALIAVALGTISREVRWRWAIAFGALGLVGSFLGSALALVVDDFVILLAFAAVVLFATVRFVVGIVRDKRRVGVGPPARGLASAAAVGIGAVTGLVGVGGGFLIAPALMSLVRMAPRAAIATSSTVILFNSLSSLGARGVLGFSFEGAVVLPVLVGAFIGGVVGKAVASRISGAGLQYASGGLLVVCCLAVGASVVQSVWAS
ncbi:TSUP family transporter [Microbacterium alcoholitolerans]|uniref:TSUP family transporter n=1 Tax=unclassified Microbacterium TaxID=2609290 RepID=UPI003D167BB2